MKSAGKISKFTIRVKTPLRQELDLLERFSLWGTGTAYPWLSNLLGITILVSWITVAPLYLMYGYRDLQLENLNSKETITNKHMKHKLTQLTRLSTNMPLNLWPVRIISPGPFSLSLFHKPPYWNNTFSYFNWL